MDARKIVVVVEDVDIARTALQWTLHNLLRYGDLITLLHVFPSTRSRNKKKLRLLRLKGFQLALSFKDICSNFPNTKTEIVVTEGDQEGGRIATMVREIGASTLVVGLHDQSFLYKLVMAGNNIANSLNCKVLAIRNPTPLMSRTISVPDSSTNMDFSQIEISSLRPSTVELNDISVIWNLIKKRKEQYRIPKKQKYLALNGVAASMSPQHLYQLLYRSSSSSKNSLSDLS